MDLLKHLNLNQKLAVMHGKGPQLILGGAGTGKTLIIANRVAYLIREREIHPINIIAVTSSNMAAKRMTKQLQNLLGNGEVPFIATFQTLCMSILRRDIHYLGFQSNFGVYDESDCQLLLHDIITEMDLDEKRFAVEAVSRRINDFKNRGLFPEGIGPIPSSDIYNRKLIEIYAAYQERLKKCNVLDYGDIVIQTVRLLTDFADVCLQYQERFQWVMVDNYEDVTTVQYQLIHLLLGEHNNLCVAGDDDQTINSRRGADVRNILEFTKDFTESTVVQLDQNFRSTSTILTATDEMIKQNCECKQNTLWTENPAGEKIRCIRVETTQDEISFVISEIVRLRTLGVPLNEMAVFYRTYEQSLPVEVALVSNALPYHIVDGVRFYSRMVVKDILAYLRVLDNPADDVSLKRIINIPPRGIGKIIVEEVLWFAFRQGINFYEALQSHLLNDRPRAKFKLTVFATMIERFRELSSSARLTELVSTIMDESGYLAYLKENQGEDGAERLENLEQLLAVIEEFCEKNPEAGLSGFLEQVSPVSDLQGKAGQQSVILMTPHAAKGLEFRVVFMIGMEEGFLPNVSALDDLDAIEEERRLCYVGMTRARECLYLLNARRRFHFDERQCDYQYDQEQNNLPSRFLKDIPQDLFADNVAQNENHKGSRLNYLYFRRSIKSPTEVISELTDEQVYLRVHGKSVTENNSAVVEVRRIRQCTGNDNMLIMQCLDGRALTPSEIDEKLKEGYVSNAELRLFQMLKALSDTNWSIYHQVDVGGLLNPIDIVAVTVDFQIYAIELDGPHHLLSSQRINDDRRDALLLNQGFNVIRIGYEKYALSCAQAAQEILLVLRGQVKPENTWRPDVRVNIDESNGATDSKHPDFYRNRPQTDPSSDCELPLGLPRRHCFIYCQSTGINERSQIVDFCLLLEEGEVRKQYYSKIKPNCPIESKATILHGINNNDVNDCPSLHSYLEQHALKKILEASDTLVVTYDWDFMGRVIKNSALRYLNWQNINKYNVVETVRLKHGLKPISKISEAVAALGISPNKYKRYDSKEYARLVREMFLVVTSRPS